MRRGARSRALGAALGAWLLAASAFAQQIVLDAPVRAGGLIFFPVQGDESRYYYVPQRAHLAVGSTGLPEFSFLRYVQNVDAGKEAGEGEGGGILHAVVQLGATDDELAAAAGELQRQRPGAQVAGPAVFKSGKFGLVSSFRDTSGALTRQVVGLGAAPILDGGRAAVSLQLTKEGAKILWQSFQTATPDVTFQFEMQLAGLRAPQRAVLEADFERIYAHQDFDVATATPTTAAEIRDVYDDLRNQGAIRLDVVGASAPLQTMIDFAYRKLMEIMFQPVGGSGTPSPEQLAAGKGGGLLDKVTKQLADARKAAQDENRARRSERRSAREAAAKRAQDLAARAKDLAALAQKSGASGADPELLAILQAEAAYLRVAAAGAGDFAGRFEDVAAPAPESAADEGPADVEVPDFAALAVFELRKSRRSDHYRVDLNQSLPDELPIAFAENIGDLRRYLDNAAVFRNVNLDDPLFKQREVYGYFEGANADDFGKQVGFVSVQMRKQHQDGEETVGEARIDRSSFSAAGNRFALVYGYKGDDDRRKWLEYEYRSLWSFADGSTLELPWTKTSFGSFPVVPPYEKRSVSVEVFDREALRAKGVRGVVVKLYGELAGKKSTASTTLRLDQGPGAAALEVLLPRGREEYEYEIQWLFAGNQTRSSGVQRSDSGVLFVDEVPEA